jgi:hypothetical protein
MTRRSSHIRVDVGIVGQAANTGSSVIIRGARCVINTAIVGILRLVLMLTFFLVAVSRLFGGQDAVTGLGIMLLARLTWGRWSR